MQPARRAQTARRSVSHGHARRFCQFCWAKSFRWLGGADHSTHLAVREDLGGDLHSCFATGRQLQCLGRATHAEFQRSLVPHGAGEVQGEGYSDIWVCACAGRLDADREGASNLRVQCEVELEVVVQAGVLVQLILPHALSGVQGERPRKVRRCDAPDSDDE